MNRSSKKGSSKKGSSRKSSSRASSSSSKGLLETAPSLVVLSPDVIDTPFMRRRFNPTEKLDLPKPAHFFDLTDAKKNKKKESEEEDIQMEKDSELDNGILTDQQKMEIARNNKGSKKSKGQYVGVGAISGLDLTSLGGPNLTDGLYLDSEFFGGNSQNNNLNNNNFKQLNNNDNDNNNNNNTLKIQINTRNKNNASGSENDTKNDLNQNSSTKKNKKKQTKFNANGQILSDDSSNSDNADFLDESIEYSDNDNNNNNNKNSDITNLDNINGKRRKSRIKNPNTGEYEYEYDNDIQNQNDLNNNDKKKRRIKNQYGEYEYEYYDENEDNEKTKQEAAANKQNQNSGKNKRRIKNQDGEYEYEYYDENEDNDKLKQNQEEEANKQNQNSGKNKRRVKNQDGEYEYEYYDENEDKEKLNQNSGKNKRRIKNQDGEYEYEYYDENEEKDKLNQDEEEAKKQNQNSGRNKRRIKNQYGEYEYEYYDENEDNEKAKQEAAANKQNQNSGKNKRRIKNQDGEYEYEYYDENEDANKANQNSGKNKRRIKNQDGEYEYEYYDENEDKDKLNQDEANKQNQNSGRNKRRVKNQDGEYEYEYYDEDEDANKANQNTGRNKRRVKNQDGEYEYEYYDEDEDANKANQNTGRNKRRIKNQDGEYEYEYYDENEDKEKAKQDEEANKQNQNSGRNKRRVKNQDGEYEYEYYDENEEKEKLNQNSGKNKRRVKNQDGEYEYEYYDENEDKEKLNQNQQEEDEDANKANQISGKNKRRIKNQDGEYEYEYYDENEIKNNPDDTLEHSGRRRRKFNLENGESEYEYYTSDSDSCDKMLSNNDIDKIIAEISDSEKQQPINHIGKRRVKKSNGEYEYEYDDNVNDNDDAKKGSGKHRGTLYNSDEFDSDDNFYFENTDQIASQNKKAEEEDEQDNIKHAPRRNVSLKSKKQTTNHLSNKKYDPDFNNFPERRQPIPGRDIDEYSVTSVQMEFENEDDLLSEGSSDKDIFDEIDQHVSFNDPESLSSTNTLGIDDSVSVSTNAFSVFRDGPEFVEKVHRQLDFNAAGPLFEEEFDKLDSQGRRVIGRLGRLQAVQKRNWLSRIWKLYDRNNNYNDEDFWRTLDAIMNDDDENSNGYNNNSGLYGNAFNRNNNGFNGNGLNNNGFNGNGFNNNGFNGNGLNNNGFNGNGFNNNGFNGNGFNGNGFNGNGLSGNGFNNNSNGFNRNGGRNYNNSNNEYINNFNEINRMSNLGFDDSMSSATSKTNKSSVSTSSWRSKKSQKGDNLTRSLMLNGMISSAREVLHQFILHTPSIDSGLPPTLNFKAAIVGPRYSGKTTFLRSLFLQTLVFLANTGNFKSTFIVPFDARDMNSSKKKKNQGVDSISSFESRENFYLFVSSLVIEALLIQRPDLQLFTSSLTKAFKELLNPSLKKPKKLPKPISSQDYLRRPMQCVDRLLAKIHGLYLDTFADNNSNNNSNLKGKKLSAKSLASLAFKSFLKEVIELPVSIAGIFGFDSTLVLFDHFDLTNVLIDNIRLADLELEMLDKCQYIVSVEDPEQFNKILISKQQMNEPSSNTKGRTKSIGGTSDLKKVQNQQTTSKATRSMSFGSKGKKLENNVSDLTMKDDEESSSKQKTQIRSFSVKNFAAKMVRVPVTDTCYSSFAENILDIELEDIRDDENQDEKENDKNGISIKNNARSLRNFKTFNNNNSNNPRKIPIPNSPIKKNISISAESCGGCPTFISRFDDICNGLLDLKNTIKPKLKLEKAVVLTEKVEILLDLLISFGPMDGPPPVKTVTMRNKDEE